MLSGDVGNIQYSTLYPPPEKKTKFEWLMDVLNLLIRLATLILILFIFLYMNSMYHATKDRIVVFLDNANYISGTIRTNMPYYQNQTEIIINNANLLTEKFVRTTNSSILHDITIMITQTNQLLSEIDGNIMMEELSEMTYDINKIASWVPSILDLLNIS